MLIQNKRKINIILYAIIIQTSLHAITENQARIGSVLLGVASAAITSKSENPAMIFGLGACVGTLGYLCFRRYTPAFRFATAKALLDGLNKDELVKGYGEIVMNIENQMRSKGVNPIRNNFQFEALLVAKIVELYPVIPDRQPYPLISATNHLTQADNDIQKISSLLDSAKPDIDPRKSAEREPLWNVYCDLNERLQRCTDNMKQARAKIPFLPDFKEQQEKYLKWQQRQQELKIQQQKADALARSADAAQKTAQAQTKQANAAASKTTLAWFKSCLYWLFNIRSK